MPKVTESDDSRPSTSTSRYLVLRHKQKRVLVPRPTSHQGALRAVKNNFPSLPLDAIKMQTNELDECRGEWVDIAPETWPCLAESSSLVSVAIVIQPPSEEPDPLENIRLTYPIKRESATPSEMPVSPTESLVPQVILRARNGKVKCWRSTTFAEMFVSSEKHFHIPPEHARFMLGDQVLDPARPLSLYIPDSRTPPPHYIEVIDVRDKESPRGESS